MLRTSVSNFCSFKQREHSPKAFSGLFGAVGDFSLPSAFKSHVPLKDDYIVALKMSNHNFFCLLWVVLLLASNNSVCVVSAGPFLSPADLRLRE
jgi:hypothetical protein